MSEPVAAIFRSDAGDAMLREAYAIAAAAPDVPNLKPELQEEFKRMAAVNLVTTGAMVSIFLPRATRTREPGRRARKAVRDFAVQGLRAARILGLYADDEAGS